MAKSGKKTTNPTEQQAGAGARRFGRTTRVGFVPPPLKRWATKRSGDIVGFALFVIQREPWANGSRCQRTAL